jgi:CRP-like cAMP-binding protein
MNETTRGDLRKTLIMKQKCFAKLTPTELDMLSELLVEQQYAAGAEIVTQGDTVDSVYFIVKGTADVRHVFIKNDKEAFKSIAKLQDGQSIGLSETGFYSVSGLRTATVIAETEMTVFRLSIAAFNGFALAYPHVNDVMRANTQTL